MTGILDDDRSPFAYNASAASTRLTAAELLANVRKFAPPKPEPIRAFQGTVADLQAAVDAENARLYADCPAIRPTGMLYGLDVVQEGLHVFVGTAKQLHDARERFGSLEGALEVSERAREASEILRRLKPDAIPKDRP